MTWVKRKEEIVFGSNKLGETNWFTNLANV
jgi:hypothetical protein